jgi:hypothetical protein
MAEKHRYVICVGNRGYAAALEVRKVYRLLPDACVEAQGLVRVVDESGEDYLYPQRFFVPIEVPGRAKRLFSSRSA